VEELPVEVEIQSGMWGLGWIVWCGCSSEDSVCGTECLMKARCGEGSGS